MSARERVVVVGGDAGGMSAASQAKKLRGDDIEVIAFEAGHFTSYSACGIPYWVAGDVPERDRLIARDAAEHERRGIDVRLRTRVDAVDVAGGKVEVTEVDTGRTYREGFDHLVVATGAVPVRPDLPGIDALGILGVQTLDDGQAVLDALEHKPARAVVVGGGYIGLEMAEAMVRREIPVTVVDQASEPMTTLDPDMGQLLHEAMEEIGVDVRTSTPVQGFETGDNGRVAAVVTHDGSIPADIVILGTGVRPNSDLAADAGLPIGHHGGLRTDLRQRVLGHDHIWAAGDCVEVLDLVTGRHRHVPLGTHANKQGRVVGRNIGGRYATFPGVVGTAVTRVCELEIARTGLREKDADEAGLEYVTARIRSRSRAGYFPGSQRMVVKMIAERTTGRLLGCQIVGREGAAKRIDVAATAVWNRMSVEEVMSLDLGYAPPFSPTWDPVLIAARKAAEAVHDAD